MSKKVYIDHLFKSYRSFPWDIMGFGVPQYAPLHSYLCQMLASYGNHKEKVFLLGKPSLGELERFHKLDDQNALSMTIHAYASKKEDMRKYDRPLVAEEVLDFLRSFPPFVENVQKTIDNLYGQGLILIPEICQPSLSNEKPKTKGLYGY